ncbi:hypothetical protein SAMN02787076_02326 [Rhizobacter sp. OV335]|nr:hypothetical protein SAMN02787076_02326 [Rhizobacter sp. OV335]
MPQRPAIALSQSASPGARKRNIPCRACARYMRGEESMYACWATLWQRAMPPPHLVVPRSSCGLYPHWGSLRRVGMDATNFHLGTPDWQSSFSSGNERYKSLPSAAISSKLRSPLQSPSILRQYCNAIGLLIRRSLVRAQVEEPVLTGPAAMRALCRWAQNSRNIRQLSNTPAPWRPPVILAAALPPPGRRTFGPATISRETVAGLRPLPSLHRPVPSTPLEGSHATHQARGPYQLPSRR